MSDENEMIKALGRFVTEVGDVEYVMFETILAVAAEDANEVHRAFYNETFGPKVKMLENRLEHSAFDEHRASLNHLTLMWEETHLATQQHHSWRDIQHNPQKRMETVPSRLYPKELDALEGFQF